MDVSADTEVQCVRQTRRTFCPVATVHVYAFPRAMPPRILAKGIRRTGPYFEKKKGKFGRLTPATEREPASFHRNAGPFGMKLTNVFS